MKRGLIAFVTTAILVAIAVSGNGAVVRAASIIGPQNVSRDPELSILPRVAQDADGNVHMVWDEQEERRVLYTKGTWSGSGYDFGPKFLLAENAGYGFGTPNVAVAPNGQIMVTWSAEGDGAPVGYAQVWDSRASAPGGSPISLGTGIQSAVAADGNSRFHIVWNGDYKIQYCEWDGGTGCSRYDVFGADNTTNNNPDIVADSNSAIHIVWHTGSNGVNYRVREQGADWGPVTGIDNGNFVSIGADGQGNVHLVWSRDFNMQYCRKTASSGCTERLEFDTGDDIRPSVGGLPNGDVIIVYQDNKGKTLQYVTRENGTWGAPTALAGGNTPPDVVGRAYVARTSIVWSGDYEVQLATAILAPTPTAVPPTPTPVPATPTPLPADARCFAETGYCMFGRIRQYWEQNGGLAVFGYPISNQARLTTLDGTYDLQLFERERLELHPENQPPFDVLLGRLGGDLLYEQGRPWETLPREQAQPGCQFFAETGHNVCEPFLSYWRSVGVDLGQGGVTYSESLQLFGLPLTTRAVETNPDGATVETQWFERARFEYYPNNPDLFKVLLGRLGAEAGLP